MGRFLLVVIVIVVVVVAIGFYRHWFEVSRNAGDDQQSVTVTMDQNRVREDVQAVRDKAKQWTQAAGKQAEEKSTGKETIHGTIRSVDVPGRLISLTTSADKDLTVQATSETKISIEGREGRLEDLRPGQRVTCVDSTKDNKHVCQSLTVERGAD
jgi:hypothetical protein